MASNRVSKNAFEFALRHIERYGDTDLFPQPFEFGAIRKEWDSSILPWLLKQDVTNWQPRPWRRILTPKASAGYRLSTQLDPLDSLFYTAIVYSLAPEIEKARIPEAAGIALAHRFRRNTAGDMWKKGNSWDRFQKRSLELASEAGVTAVLKADIADFYARIYHHRLENRLFEISQQALLVRALMRLLEAWNGRVSYGIPIGQAASRLLAELVLDDIDRNLMDEGFTHCRWIDDFRIFCRSMREARRAEAFLTKALSESHGLSLQQSKTKAVLAVSFRAEIHASDTVRVAVDARTRELIDPDKIPKYDEIDEEFGDIDDYEAASMAPMEYEELPANIRAIVKRFTIAGVLRYVVHRQTPNLGLAKVLLRKLGEDQDETAFDIVVDALPTLIPILADAVTYLISVQAKLGLVKRRNVGKQCISLLQQTDLADSAYSTMWLLWLFAASSSFDNESTFASLYNQFSTSEARRKVILALGNAENAGWFRMRRNDLAALPPWEKRAFLYGARCLLPDERDHWYKSVRAQLDVLDTAVVAQARAVAPSKSAGRPT